jgi:phage protein D
MGLLDLLPALPVTQDSTKGIRPSERRPGLLDPELPGELGADRFAPNYILVINKETMPEEVTQYITSIEYEDNEELFDQLKITLSGHYEDEVRQETIPIPQWVQSSTLFSEGNIVWIYMGYGSDVKLIGGAEIIKREFSYSDTPSATIICYEPIHRMANTFAEKQITYKGMRSSDIVKKIGRKSAYSGAIGALFDVSNIARLPIFTPRAEVQKQGESDWAFLKRMADVRGWQLYTRFDDTVKKFQLFYGPDVDKQEALFRYEYNADIVPEDSILSFTPEINTIDQNTEIEVVSLDEQRKKEVKSNQKYDSLVDGRLVNSRKFSGNNTDFQQSELKNPAAYRINAFGVSKRIIANRPFKDENEVKKFAIQWARNTIKNFITGDGSLVGNESLQSRQSLYLMGLGETFSGTETKPAKWYITKITHKISSGSGLTYQNSYNARKVIDWLPGDDIVANIPAYVAEKEKASKLGRFEFLTKLKEEGSI